VPQRNFSIKIFLFSLTILFGCNSPSPKEKVVIYSPHGKEMLGYFEKKFEAANPSIDVVWLDMGSQNVLDRVRTEKENPQADIWWGGPKEIFEQAESLNLFAAFQPSWAASLAPEYKSRNGFWFATFLSPQCIMYNTELLDSIAAPKDWDDLLDEKWQQKIIIRDPIPSGTMRTIFAAMIEKERKRTGSIDSGFAWLAKLHANTKSYAADPSQLFIKLARGEAIVTLWNMNDALLQARENNYPFGFMIPKSGTVFAIEGIALIDGAKHLENAKKFYEFVTTPESLKEQAEKFYRLPARKDVMIQTEWMTGRSFEPLDINADSARANQAVWIKHWQETIRAK